MGRLDEISSRPANSWPATFSARVIWGGWGGRSERYSAASREGRPRLPQTDPLREGDRLMTICNSCRYCEGFCPVFPAMERRLQFREADLNFLANLCHNCSECFYACQYAPPHEFAVNVPKVLAEIRVKSYRKYSWPGIIRSAVMVTALGVVFTAVALVFTPQTHGGDFYAAISHGVMVGFFGALGVLVLAFWSIGLARFWQEDRRRPGFNVSALFDAVKDVLSLSNLSSHGAGCTYPD